MPTFTTPFLTPALLVLLAAATPALAQTALGDGRGLQRDLSASNRANTPRADFLAEVRLRNALVTGNVGGGRSLRIQPPYSAGPDFRARLGSDDLFAFRRDSIESSTLYRGTEGLQYQYSRSTGNTQGPANPYITRLDASPVTTPPSAGLGGLTPIPTNTPPFRPSDAAVRTDDRSTPERGLDPIAAASTSFNTLRSTASFASTRGLAPAVVGYQQTATGIDRLTASTLLGLRRIAPIAGVPNAPTDAQRREADRLDAARRDLAGAGSAAGGAPAAPGPDLSAAGRAVPAPSFRTAYDDVALRLARADERARARDEAAAASPGADDAAPRAPRTLDSRLADLRSTIDGSAPAPTPSAAPGTDPAPTPRGLDPETLRILRESGGDVNAYVSGTPGATVDAELRRGQDALAAGRYFEAEERFASALSMRPGDVTAMAGRLNAQLGAGLYLSAALNLRQLYTERPEAIAIRFAFPALPAPQRMATLVEELRANIKRAADADRPPPHESALLLAYAGHQIGDDAVRDEGLAALRRAAPDSPEGAAPLADLLEGVWIDADAPAEGK